MRNAFAIILLIAVFNGGCAAPRGATPQDIEHKNADLADLSKSRIVTVVNEPYLGARAMPLPKNAELGSSGGIFSRSITLNKRGSMTELCATVSSMTGLPIVVNGKTSGGASASLPSGSSLDAELQAALGGSPGGAADQASGQQAAASSGSRNGGFRVSYSGPVKGLLDVLASHSGLSWQYNADNGVVFDSANVKTFTLWAAPGKVKFSNKITNESKESSGSSSGESRQDTSIQTAQTNTTELEFDIWQDVEKEVKGLLSSSGTVTINQAAGTITVKDSPYSIKQVAKYVDELNEKLSRQIALSVKVWSLEIDDSGDIGLDLSVFFENADVKVFSGASPLSFARLGGEISSAIVSGKLKDSTAVLKGLRSVGKATQVTSGSGVVMSNQPVPIQAIRRDAYLASSSRTISDTGNTTELLPGEVTTGFAMTVIPHIMEGRRVILQYTVNLSNLDDITTFTSDESSIQLPKVSSRSFSQRMSLKMGQTLVLAGFEQEIDGGTIQGGFLGLGRSREYKKSLIVITISTESGDV